MKLKEILSAEDAQKISDQEDGPCLLCHMHELADKKIEEGFDCPHCGHKHSGLIIFDHRPIGEANIYAPEDNIAKLPVICCDHCTEYFTLMPEKISWNANHDVYYTGGKYYLNDADESEIFKHAQKEIAASLQQWVDRYNSGEKLEPSYPALWIKRSITEAIAKYLFEKGFKK